ncbi:peptidase T, partial [Myxococcota bacterium]|nr:peptidase T [Myxococcota bacterium]
MDILSDVVERFSRYVRIDTQSREPETPDEAKRYPSTEKQKDLGRLLQQELRDFGLSDVIMDEWGYVMATLPSNVNHSVPVIGLIAHMDTSPAASGKDVEPIFHHNYQGGSIEY